MLKAQQRVQNVLGRFDWWRLARRAGVGVHTPVRAVNTQLMSTVDHQLSYKVIYLNMVKKSYLICDTMQIVLNS